MCVPMGIGSSHILSLIHIFPVIFEEQNINSIYPESEFLIAIHGAFAQSESESTSSRVRWGQRQSMKSGRVTMQYKWMLGYEKGPDGKPLINEEQAETVRFIYQRYLAGDTPVSYTHLFLRLYYKLRHHGMPVLSQLLTDLQTAQNRKLLWSLDIVELNKQITDITRQERLLAELKQQGLVDPDIYLTRSNTLAEQLRTAKLEKERFLESEEDQTIRQTQLLLEVLEDGPEFLEAFDEELFSELVAKIIVENNECLRFRLANGLELTEPIERTVR